MCRAGAASYKVISGALPRATPTRRFAPASPQGGGIKKESRLPIRISKSIAVRILAAWIAPELLRKSRPPKDRGRMESRAPIAPAASHAK
jgi:hypothetical protein